MRSLSCSCLATSCIPKLCDQRQIEQRMGQDKGPQLGFGLGWHYSHASAHVGPICDLSIASHTKQDVIQDPRLEVSTL